MKRLTAVQQVEACWSDTPIGPIGVYCPVRHADRVVYIADRDIYSYVDRHGRRQFEDSRVTFQATILNLYDDPYSPDEIEEMYREQQERTPSYVEVCAVAEPWYIWVDPKYGTKWHKIARVLGRAAGLPVVRLA